MNLEKLVAVSGVSGIYKLVTTRNNGLVLEDMDSGKKRFFTSRKYQFTPLESISIYVGFGEDTVELAKVFETMKEQIESNPPISPKSSSSEIRTYFETILPEHNQERVLISDIKKLIKWFEFLNERNLLIATEEATEEETAEEENIEEKED